MSLSTQAFVPAATKKSANTGDGSTAEKGQESAQTAAEFRSLLQGMKKDEATQSRGSETTGSSENQVETPAMGEVEGGNSSVSTDGPAKAIEIGKTGFAASNLADALRQVSQTVMSQKEQPLLPKEGADGDAGPSDAVSGPQLPGHLSASSSALAVNAVLAARADAQAQGAGTAQQGRPVMPYQGAGDAAASRKGAGEGEISKTGTSSLFAQFGVEPEKVADPLSDRSAGRSLLLDEAAGSLKVLRQETHFAPNMRLSPAQQVGDQVTTALSELTAGKTSLSEGISTKAEGPVLKTLDIQLTPHELGTVKVSLKIVGDTVEVSMVASNAQTAELLKQDKQMLDQMLRATGFKADTVTVQAADDRTAVQQTSQAGTSGSATSQNGAGQSAAGDGAAQNFNGSGSGQQNGRAGQNGPEEVFRNSDTTKGKGHEESTGVSLSDGIYL